MLALAPSDAGSILGMIGGAAGVLAVGISIVYTTAARSQARAASEQAEAARTSASAADRSAAAAERAAAAAEQQAAMARLAASRDLAERRKEALTTFPMLRVVGSSLGSPHSTLSVAYQAGEIAAKNVRACVVRPGMRAEGERDLLRKESRAIDIETIPIAPPAPPSDHPFYDVLVGLELERDEAFVGLAWASMAGGRGQYAYRQRIGGSPVEILNVAEPPLPE